jgi:hypothetical protein
MKGHEAKKPFWKRPSKPTSPPPRTREEIQELYNRACNEAGDIQYKLVSMSKRLEWLTNFRGELNDEIARLDHAEAVLRERVAAEMKAEEQVPEGALPTAPPAPEAQH